VKAIAGIRVLAQLNEDESDLRDLGADNYIVVDFILFADLDDGRRIETATVYQEGGPRSGWGPVEGWPVERQLSTSRVEEMARLRIGPSGQLRHAWKGVSSRLVLEGLSVSVDELFAAPFRVDIDPSLERALTT
jgi:hypothetical protein